MEVLTGPADTVIKAIELGVTLIFTYMGYRIKLAVSEGTIAQQKMKEELIEKQTDMRRDIDTKHHENAQAIAVHQAEDAQRFDSIARTLNRMDVKLDKLNGSH